MRRSLWVLALSVGACSDRSVVVVPELPDDVAWLGVLFPSPTLTVGSGLYPVTAGRTELPVEVPEDADDLLVVGFSEAALERYRPPGATTLATHPLLPASSGYALMDPSFSALGSLEEGSGFEPDPIPRPLSAEWRPPCADLALSGERRVHLPCARGPCAPRATQTDCTLVIDAPACELRWEAALHRDGRIVVAPPSVLEECSATHTGAEPLLSCQGPQVLPNPCPITLLPPGWEAPRVEQAGVELAPGIDLAAPDARSKFRLRGLARHERRAFTLSGELEAFAERTCPAAARWIEVDVDRLEVVRTATAPDCPWAMGYDPVGPALLLAHGDQRARLSRVDLGGNVIASTELPAGLHPPEWFPNNAFVEPASRAVVVPLRARQRASGEPDIVDWWVLVYDADTLALRGAPLAVPRLTQTVMPEVPGVVTLLHGDATLSFLDTQVPRLRLGLATGALCGPAGAYPSGFYDQRRDRFVLASRGGHLHGVTELERDGMRCQTGFTIESPRSAYAILPWPNDPSLVLAGLDGLPRAPDLDDSTLAFFDLEKRRFLLGEQRIGVGPVTNMITDGAGGVLVLLPAEGKLVRVRPRADGP